MRILLIAVLTYLVLSSFCTAGQYYKFIDENGVVSFTDDLSKIPKEQRPEVEVSREISNSPESKEMTPPESIEPDDTSGLENKDTDDPAKLDREAEELKKMKAELDKEADDINGESIRLIEEGKGVKGRNNVEEYNIKVDKLNEKTDLYQAKQAEYVKRANEYNAKIQQKSVK